jgi:hypothetical protein
LTASTSSLRRVYNVEDARTFLRGQEVDVDAIAPQVEGFCAQEIPPAVGGRLLRHDAWHRFQVENARTSSVMAPGGDGVNVIEAVGRSERYPKPGPTSVLRPFTVKVIKPASLYIISS